MTYIGGINRYLILEYLAEKGLSLTFPNNDPTCMVVEALDPVPVTCLPSSHFKDAYAFRRVANNEFQFALTPDGVSDVYVDTTENGEVLVGLDSMLCVIDNREN